MIPVIALVGRPNVGKSTLFNRLMGTQQALVVDQPGVTRDRQFGEGEFEGQPYILIDTGGIIERPENPLDKAMLKQSQQAIQEADAVFFVVDARQGLTPSDILLAKQLRKQEKKLFLVVNKVDGLNAEVACSEFYKLGFPHVIPTAASQNWGMNALMSQVLEHIVPETEDFEDASEIDEDQESGPRIAIIGRPNVGKSTLVNRMLGEERVIVCDYAGTTRDSISIPMERMGKPYTLVDTAGVRRKKNISEVVEKFSVVKTLQAIKEANVIILVFDATEGLTDQDLNLISFAIDAGRGLIVCANKWDGMDPDDREQVKVQLKHRLRFCAFAPIHFISALHGTGVGDLFGVADKVYQSAMMRLNTNQVSEILTQAITAHPPPLIHGRRIKLRYAHCGGHNPLTIVIHGNQTEELPQSYERYLSKFYMKVLKMKGAPVRIICRTSDNPYKDKVNLLTPRQIYKRKRLMAHVKKSARR